MISRSRREENTPSIHPNPRRLEWAAFAPPSESKSDDLIFLHIETCPLCASKIEALRSGRSAFLEENSPETFLQAIEIRAHSRRAERRRSATRWIPLGLAAGVLICLSLVFIYRTGIFGGKPQNDFPGISLKGGGAPSVSLELYVSRGGLDAVRWNKGPPLYPGDVLKFGVKSASDRFVMIANIDDRGAVSLYNPLDNAPSARVPGGRLTVIKESILLDDFVGNELIVLLASKTPLNFVAVKAALEEAYHAAKGNLNRIVVKGIDAEISLTPITKVAP